VLLKPFLLLDTPKTKKAGSAGIGAEHSIRWQRRAAAKDLSRNGRAT
jgi:hypothetical protein